MLIISYVSTLYQEILLKFNFCFTNIININHAILFTLIFFLNLSDLSSLSRALREIGYNFPEKSVEPAEQANIALSRREKKSNADEKETLKEIILVSNGSLQSIRTASGGSFLRLSFSFH